MLDRLLEKCYEQIYTLIDSQLVRAAHIEKIMYERVA
jgi:hypothetical protein